MGGDIIPDFVSPGDAQVYDFTQNSVPGTSERDKAYWRDVGTIDAYHEAHMDLVSVDPVFNLYNLDWPIWTYPVQTAGCQVHPRRHRHRLRGQPGLHHLRRVIDDSVLSPNVRVAEERPVNQSVLLSSVRSA